MTNTNSRATRVSLFYGLIMALILSLGSNAVSATDLLNSVSAEEYKQGDYPKVDIQDGQIVFADPYPVYDTKIVKAYLSEIKSQYKDLYESVPSLVKHTISFTLTMDDFSSLPRPDTSLTAQFKSQKFSQSDISNVVLDGFSGYLDGFPLVRGARDIGSLALNQSKIDLLNGFDDNYFYSHDGNSYLSISYDRIDNQSIKVNLDIRKRFDSVHELVSRKVYHMRNEYGVNTTFQEEFARFWSFYSQKNESFAYQYTNDLSLTFFENELYLSYKNLDLDGIKKMAARYIIAGHAKSILIKRGLELNDKDREIYKHYK